jgi:hypothetical protein
MKEDNEEGENRRDRSSRILGDKGQVYFVLDEEQNGQTSPDADFNEKNYEPVSTSETLPAEDGIDVDNYSNIEDPPGEDYGVDTAAAASTFNIQQDMDDPYYSTVDLQAESHPHPNSQPTSGKPKTQQHSAVGNANSPRQTTGKNSATQRDSTYYNTAPTDVLPQDNENTSNHLNSTYYSLAKVIPDGGDGVRMQLNSSAQAADSGDQDDYNVLNFDGRNRAAAVARQDEGEEGEQVYSHLNEGKRKFF